VVFFLVLDEVEDVFGDFLNRLDELGLSRVATLHTFDEAVQIDVVTDRHVFPHSRGAGVRRTLDDEAKLRIPYGLTSFADAFATT